MQGREFSNAAGVIFIALSFGSGLNALGQAATSSGPLSAPSPGSSGHGGSQFVTKEDFDRLAMKLEESAILKSTPQTSGSSSTPFLRRSYPVREQDYPWHIKVGTELFWVGQPGSGRSSAWDPEWEQHYGGVDNPKPSARRNYIPIAFTPHQNPFYCELPYNDVTGDGSTKPEAPLVIPWFLAVYRRSGQTVCEGRWIEISAPNGRTCYAQWSDCGPRKSDAWQYVFGTESPPVRRDNQSGIGISPAVRDYLSLGSSGVASWRFVDPQAVQDGPWSSYMDGIPARWGPTVIPPESRQSAAQLFFSMPSISARSSYTGTEIKRWGF